MEDQAIREQILKAASADSAATAWAGFHSQEAHESFCDRFARIVAEQYLSGALAFEAADQAMSRLNAYCYHLDEDRGMPDFSWRVFEAFEEGEYMHEGDPPGTDNEEKYVRPLLLQLHA